MQNNKQILDKLTTSRKITPDGRDWLVTALDPFHDYERQMAGFPDSDGSQTVVSLYQYQTTISAPAGCAGNWDAHIFTAPLNTAKTFDSGTMLGSMTYFTLPAVPAQTIVGLLNIHSNASGSSLVVPAAVNYTETTLPLINNIDVSKGVSRIVAMGYEIHNTTAELQKQGTLTTYRMPQYAANSTWLHSNNAATEKGIRTGVRFLQPPQTADQAMLLKGTRVWEAKDGVYVACALDSNSNPLSVSTSKGVLFDTATEPSGANSVSWESQHANLIANAAPVPTSFADAVNKTNPFDTSGTFLTGLSNATTFTVSLRVYVEKAPSWNSPELAVLATPSAGYDIKALELYATAINMLPVGVKVGENAKGDWWRSVLRAVGAAAEVVGMGAGTLLPGAPLIGKGINTLIGTLTKTGDSKQYVDNALSKITSVAESMKTANMKAGGSGGKVKNERKKK